MTTYALVTMVLVQGTVIFVTAYFFRKVLKAPIRQEPDSYSENDELER